MIYRRMPGILRLVPDALRRQILHFESEIEAAVRSFASGFTPGVRILDAGAGEAQYKPLFEGRRYVAIDLGVGDADWSYRALDVVGDLSRLPFASSAFDGCLNVVTLEHVREPQAVVSEMARVLRPGGKLLLVTPLEWEEHQQPHDYFRYTRYGLEYLLTQAGLQVVSLKPVGGFFRLLSRRLLNAPQFFPRPVRPFVLAVVAIPALAVAALDGLDTGRNFTLGHVCLARKPE